MATAKDSLLRPYSEFTIHPTSVTASLPTLTSVDSCPQPIEIHPYAEVVVPPNTALPDLATNENLTSATAAQPPPTPNAPKVVPYAEVSILPTTAQPNLAEDSSEGIGNSGPCGEISTAPSITEPRPPIVEINPYAEITIEPQPPTITSSLIDNNDDGHSMDPTTSGDDKGHSRRMSLDPRLLHSTSTTDTQEEVVETKSGNRRGRRLSLGARLFLKSNAGTQGSAGGVGRRRLSLGLRSYHRAKPSAAEEENEPTDLAHLLASFRSSGVSFPTNNNPGPRLRKTVVEEELNRGSSFRSRRRRMTVGARFFQRPTTEIQSSTDSGVDRQRRMSVGARFLRRTAVAGGSQVPTASSETGTRRRMSIRARLVRTTHNSRRRVGSKVSRFFRQFSAIPESSATGDSGAPNNDDRSTVGSEGERGGRRMSLGARLLQKLTFHEESPSSTSNSSLSIDLDPAQLYHEETTSASSGAEQASVDLADLLDILRASGVSFQTNRILESRERVRAIPRPPLIRVTQ